MQINSNSIFSFGITIFKIIYNYLLFNLIDLINLLDLHINNLDYNFEIKRGLILGRKAMTNLDSIMKSRYHFANKGPCSQSYGFSSSHIWM